MGDEADQLTQPVESLAASTPAAAAVAADERSAGGNGAERQPLIGSIVEGTVSGITHFGAFVSLDGGASGLIHISEIAHQYVRDVREHLRLNDRVRVKVLQQNPNNGKFDLSLKQTKEAPVDLLPRMRRGRRERSLPEGADPAFEEKMSKFLKTSEERLLDVKRNLEAKRGGKYR